MTLPYALAAVSSDYLSKSISPDRAIRLAFAETKSISFHENAQARQHVRSLVAGQLAGIITRFEDDIVDVVEEFARYAESQAAQPLKKNRGEEFARTLVEAFLNARGYLIRRESHEGAGRTDLIASRRGSEEFDVVEVKVPRSRAELDDGLEEVAQYAQSLGRPRAVYVVVDHVRDLNAPGCLEDLRSDLDVDGVRVSVIRVRVAGVPPSRVGAARRRAARSVSEE